jgi:hypothetical protein
MSDIMRAMRTSEKFLKFNVHTNSFTWPGLQSFMQNNAQRSDDVGSIDTSEMGFEELTTLQQKHAGSAW